MRKGLEEFKEALLGGEELERKLSSVKSLEDVYEIAKEEGYDFTLEELEDSEVSDDILDCVAGGKGDTYNKKQRIISPGAKNNTVIFKQ